MGDDLREVAIRTMIVCVAVTWLVILWRADRDESLKNFSLAGFVMTKEGFPDRPGIMELGTWIIFSLILMYLAAHDKFTEGLAFIYVAFPAVRAGVVSFQKGQAPPAPPFPQGTVITEDTTKTTKTRKVEPTPELEPERTEGVRKW